MVRQSLSPRTSGRHRHRPPQRPSTARSRSPVVCWIARAGQACPDRPGGEGLSLGAGDQRHRGAFPWERLLLGFPYSQGQDARRPARPRSRRRTALDTERVALRPLFDMIRRFKIGFDAGLHKRTAERGLLSLIGPDAVGVADAEGWRTSSIPTRSSRSRASRCWRSARTWGPTHDLSGERHRAAHERIARTRRTDGVRADGGDPPRRAASHRYGIDLDDTVIPQEAGLNERAVSFTKGCYVGQETVARLYYRGKPNRHLRGLRLSEAGRNRR